MKKYFLSFAMMAISVALLAVPAKRGFRDCALQDGTTVSLQLVGDEFAHWYESADGTVYVQNADGTFAPSAASREQMAAKRKVSRMVAAAQRRQKMFGTTPNPAPKGIVILINFKDTKMQTAHTQAVFDELCNSTNCTVNDGYPSAAEYFSSQSNGVYRPVFDVFGPVTLSRNASYYGKNDSDGNDEYATDAVIEACILANNQYDNLNFADYDSDNDGYVDFVYAIYAGKGEADGGAATTIWPHNWSIQELVVNYSAYTSYTKSQTKLDNVYLDNYAMSSELSGNTLGGIGTLCHEFGHVMGLPDFYETDYGNNYKNALTPNDWDVMDGGAYNGDGHCPPNYSPWEKYFFGWHTPVNLGNEGQLLTLHANGTQDYQAYQINTSGNLIGATTAGECYYIENRQLQGWDAGLPHHGMLIWKVNYNATAWANNAPNNDGTSGSPLYTIVSASGTKIGTHINSSQTAYVYDGPKNPYPGSQNVHSKTIAGKPLLNINEANGLIALTYIEEPVAPVDPFTLTWMANGEEFATTTSTGKIVMPATEPQACGGKVFVGWCKIADYENETIAPELVQAGHSAQEGDIFYAVFATEETTSSVEQTTTYTFTSKNWAEATGTWTGNEPGNQLTSGQGVQVTANCSGAGAATEEPLTNVSKIVVKYCTNASRGAGSISVTVGSTEVSKNVTKNGGTTLRELEYMFNNVSGVASFVVTCSTNSIYVYSITVTAGGSGTIRSGYTTNCPGTTTVVEATLAAPRVIKAIRKGQVVIIRDGVEYNLLGVQQ